MKKSYITILILSIINSIVLTGIIITLIIGNHKPIDSTEIFKNNIDSVVEVKASASDIGESYGSGVIYSSDGYLITNAHVVSYTTLGEIKTFETYEIRFAKDEDYMEAEFVKMDNELDLAILKIKDDIKYSPISFSKDTYTYGDIVYAIGNTSNYGIGISCGIISVPEVNIIYNEISRKVIQADIDIASGNSGGALLDKKGRLIGITTFRTKDLSNTVNYGFAYSIPVRIVKEYIGE